MQTPEAVAAMQRLYGLGWGLPSSTVCPSISSLFLNKNNMLTEKPKAVVVARPCLISG